MARITIHARKVSQGYLGYLKIVDGPLTRTASTRIVALTKADALKDAAREKDTLALRDRITHP
jgi:hypothetical protein